MKHCSKFAVLGLSLALGACSTLQSEKINYRSAGGQTSTLEVPPDLTQLAKDSPFNLSDGAVTASNYQAHNKVVAAIPTAINSLGDVRIERSGNTRWLVVQRSADKLWQPIKDFWQDNGFVLAQERPELGIMETDWAENRAKIPQDFIRSALGSVFDSLYSTGERDKFRTRIERNDDGSSAIFISHRGMVEVYDSKAQDHTVWQPRPIDPELEAEFLRRLMVKLGVSAEQAKAMLGNTTTKPSAQISSINNQTVLQLAEDFDHAWVRVGQSLDRINFTVQEGKRSQGLYLVRYEAPSADLAKEKPGFFKRLFGSTKTDEQPQQFRVLVQSQGNSTTVAIQNSDGSNASAADAKRIIELLAQDLR